MPGHCAADASHAEPLLAADIDKRAMLPCQRLLFRYATRVATIAAMLPPPPFAAADDADVAATLMPDAADMPPPHAAAFDAAAIALRAAIAPFALSAAEYMRHARRFYDATPPFHAAIDTLPPYAASPCFSLFLMLTLIFSPIAAAFDALFHRLRCFDAFGFSISLIFADAAYRYADAITPRRHIARLRGAMPARCYERRRPAMLPALHAATLIRCCFRRMMPLTHAYATYRCAAGALPPLAASATRYAAAMMLRALSAAMLKMLPLFAICRSAAMSAAALSSTR